MTLLSAEVAALASSTLGIPFAYNNDPKERELVSHRLKLRLLQNKCEIYMLKELCSLKRL